MSTEASPSTSTIPKPIESVAIVCYKRDIDLARACIASVRRWYPEIPISLFKDLTKGDFSTVDAERHFGVTVLEPGRTRWGWGWGTIGAILAAKGRVLMMDADTVMIGPVIDLLNQFSEDFIVTGVATEDPDDRLINRDYIRPSEVKRHLDPDYVFPGYGFNTGQMVVECGELLWEDFLPYLEQDGDLRNRYPDVLPYTDQGMLNYILQKKRQAGEITVRYETFWLWPPLAGAEVVDLEAITHGEGYPAIMHWAGCKEAQRSRMARHDILRHYEDLFYRRLPSGEIRRLLRNGYSQTRMRGVGIIRRIFKLD